MTNEGTITVSGTHISQRAFTRKVIRHTRYVRGESFEPEDFSGMNMSGLSVPSEADVTLAGAKFDSAILDNINAIGIDFTGCSFRGASLKKANLVSAILNGCDFDGADLTCANLSYADMRGAHGANIESAYAMQALTEQTTEPKGDSQTVPQPARR